ncbi:histidine phosphatase family protein [Furfurilactobacillus siliginis]|uniref:Phosphoglycerate mutase n=1 Tax=Furfurilactobacillus siliginis TaxID=348151 RepID=A0A0R2LAV6_9LACO|nr:histidine phosphatase family protein [Furfurilactobacillus siliginis]KRN96428.1 phosphoglycerate mutase [Furfurilactobacillus siliginis]GEK29190.1 phosphoglycerate mutase [Furfurilactobacillus siliginis]
MADVTLYLVRHGQTYFNIYNKLQGWSNSPLTDKGLADAKDAGTRLAHVSFAAAYCSDTTRAQQTAAEILAANQVSDVKQPVSSLFFREQFYGSFEGDNINFVWDQVGRPHGLTSFKEIEAKRSIAESKDMMKAADPFHDAESNDEYWARVDQGFAMIRANSELSDGDNVLVISHGNTLLSLMERYGGGQFDLSERPANGSVTKLALTDKGISVLSYNEK